MARTAGILQKERDDLKDLARTTTARAKGWLILAALGVGAVTAIGGGAVFLLLTAGQQALSPLFGSWGAAGAGLALGGAILAAVGLTGWVLTRRR